MSLWKTVEKSFCHFQNFFEFDFFLKNQLNFVTLHFYFNSKILKSGLIPSRGEKAEEGEQDKKTVEDKTEGKKETKKSK